MHIHHHRPRPVVSTPVSITSGAMVIIAIIAHTPNWSGHILSLILCTTLLLVSVPTPNKLWNCWACGTCYQSICVLHPQRRPTLKSWQRLLMAVTLALPKEIHKLLKFSIAIQIVFSGFSLGAWPYFLFPHKSATEDVTWHEAILLAWASWWAVIVILLSFCLWWACLDFLVAIAIISCVEGRCWARNAHDPQSNRRDWDLKCIIASDSAQRLPWTLDGEDHQ